MTGHSGRQSRVWGHAGPGEARSAHGPQTGLVHRGRAQRRRERPLTPPPAPRCRGAPTARRRSHDPGGGRGPGLRRVSQEAPPRLPAGAWAPAQSTQAWVYSGTRITVSGEQGENPNNRLKGSLSVETTLPCKELHEIARSISEIQKTTRVFLSWMKMKKGNFTILAHDSLRLVMNTLNG